MTTRRTGKNRKPPRQPAARPTARPVDSLRSGETSSGETVSDNPFPVEAVASGPADTVATGEPVTPPRAEAESTRSGSTESEIVAPESAPEQAFTEEQAEAPLAATVAEASPADDAAVEVPLSAPSDEAEDRRASQEIAPEPVAGEPVRDVIEEPAAPLDAADEPAVAKPACEAIDPAADRVPSPTEATSETPERPAAADRGEIPLAAMQGLIEINGRLVAFMRGEGEAAVAFWKAAMTVRSPGDLAQLQAAEVSRAFDAALACWTDVARRMGRFTAPARSGARAA